MEPNNFEKDFREKLNQRKIEPSDKAWDRLDAMLSVAEEKKQPKNKKRWMYIAASIVGFLLVGTFFFNQKKSVVETPKNNVVIKENLQKDTVVKPDLDIINPVKTEVAVSEKAANQNSVKEEKNLNVKPNKTLKTKSNQIAESSIIIKNNQPKQSLNNQSLAVETSKKETVDQLLESAEKTVVAENSAKPKSKVKINANDLLNQVDGELELSFREKMITKVNKNYQTVKVALANRNQQE
ncbi:hypothetical protein FLA105534_03617 [Flavobacterium bizetiae]|uniref:Uncharacterized protein n=1 Tax=Flavobacterium bizetiae TaxID=2704140 RepID=A0A6J4GQD1_9FLAO|nr:hypothetical protein [Flavobacterium bizetiae]CAA9201481.1 hypothetical protein FLA105534_03617 [Flavobacterium bizetiae]CAD5342088.1 hypothetical protein FLA105535_02069 [Flavobacterium bizetiae]CAD5347731.1 hypothetical protein FLA105534_01689 [Flavobacterium bizetiae]